jgi:hypothetical protein
MLEYLYGEITITAPQACTATPRLQSLIVSKISSMGAFAWKHMQFLGFGEIVNQSKLCAAVASSVDLSRIKQVQRSCLFIHALDAGIHAMILMNWTSTGSTNPTTSRN